MNYLDMRGIFYIWDQDNGNPTEARCVEADSAKDAVKKYTAERCAYECSLGTYVVTGYPFNEIRTYDCSVEVKTTWKIKKVKP